MPSAQRRTAPEDQIAPVCQATTRAYVPTVAAANASTPTTTTAINTARVLRGEGGDVSDARDEPDEDGDDDTASPPAGSEVDSRAASDTSEAGISSEGDVEGMLITGATRVAA